MSTTCFTRLVLLIAVCGIGPGCAAQLATIRQLDPERVDDLPRSLAVMNVQGGGPYAPLAHTALTDSLRAIGFYELVEEAEMDHIAPGPLRLDNGALNLPVAGAAARDLQIDALLLTRLAFRQADKSPLLPAGDGKVAALLQFELIDMRTGQPAAQQTCTSDYTPTKLAQGDNEAKALAQLIRQAAGKVARGLAPHTSQVEVRLAGKALGRGVESLRRGNNSAIAGNWEQALEHWSEAVDDDARNHAAWYNLGLGLQSLHQYAQAQHAFEKAVQIRDRSLYRQALDRCQQAANAYRLAIEHRIHGPSSLWHQPRQLAQLPVGAGPTPPAVGAPPARRAPPQE